MGIFCHKPSNYKLTQSTHYKLLSRIYGKGRGWVLTPNDFKDLGNQKAVSMALSRLVEKETIRRLARGLYDYPRASRLVGLVSPSPDEIAQALARESASKIQPSGAYAANLLGLTEQVPAKIVFLTDGATRKVTIGNQQIQLKQTTPKNMQTAGRISGLVIQALRFLGKSQVDENHVENLRSRLTAPEKQQLVKDIRFAPVWIGEIFNDLVREPDNES